MTGLKIAKELGVQHLKVLVIHNLLSAKYRVNMKLENSTWSFMVGEGPSQAFATINVHQILRSENTRADLLSKLTTMGTLISA